MQLFIEDIEGFVLTGGASRRMGTDKSQLKLGDGKTFVEQVRAALSLTARTRIVGRTTFAPSWLHNDEDSAASDLPFVCDVYRTADGHAPQSALTGLHAALWHARTPWVAVIACDLPFVTDELIRRLAALRDAEDGTGEYEAVVPVQPDGRRQPLCALYRRTPALRRATEALDRNEYKLNSFLAHLRTRDVAPSELADLPGAQHFFININTPGEYTQAKTE